MSKQRRTQLVKPIKGEEWIEKKRKHEFWIAKKESYPQKFYARICKSYIGWWAYFHLHSLSSRAALLIDPHSCGGLWSHINCFLYNAIIVDIWWSLKHRLWKLFHQEEWKAQERSMQAAMQAFQEGYADQVPPPPGFERRHFTGFLLGERYFKRVEELLRETGKKDQAKKT